MSLERRIEDLERSNQRLRKLSGLCLVGFIALMSCGAAIQKSNVQDVTLTKRLAIVDDAGHERIVLAINGDEASISLTGEDSSIYLTSSKKAFTIQSWAGKDEKSSSSFLWGTDTSVANWYYSNPGFGTQQAVVFASEGGNGFSAWAPNGSGSRGSIRMLRPDNTPRMILDNKEGKTQCVVGLDKNGQPEIVVGPKAESQKSLIEGRIKIKKESSGKLTVSPIE